jgi:chorismate-pyruvate lyase
LNSADFADVELDLLIKLFFDNADGLGSFEEVSAEQVEEPSRTLLAHDHHMTVTLEEYHNSPVDVKVLQSRTDGDHYSRKILLTRQSDGGVVQYGIVRLNLSILAPDVRQEIENQQTPLGRILINHNVLRVVKLLSLLRIKSGPDLAAAFGFEIGQICFGRTALIYCDGAPAIELLEIVC